MTFNLSNIMARSCISVTGLILLGLLTGCSTIRDASYPTSLLRTAVDVPDHFLVGFPNSTATEEPMPGSACRNPLVDPRHDERLILVRSRGGRGDYEVASGRYGVGEGELLRVDCGTGRAIGVVRR